MQAVALDQPALVWGTVPRTARHGGAWLFYTEDYRYEQLWKEPGTLLQTKALSATEPNFSAYENMPLPVALWSIYRKRWIARYWQSQGVRVFADLNVAVNWAHLNRLPMTTRPQRYTAEEVAAAVYEAKGWRPLQPNGWAATRLQCATMRPNIPTVREAITQAREDLKDFAESKLLRRIDDDDLTAIIFFLKTQAKDRGYVERAEVTGADGGPLHIIEVELGKPARSAAQAESFDGDAPSA
jgi:hypothetical protein